jgi:hypothetical protein
MLKQRVNRAPRLLGLIIPLKDQHAAEPGGNSPNA